MPGWPKLISRIRQLSKAVTSILMAVPCRHRAETVLIPQNPEQLGVKKRADGRGQRSFHRIYSSKQSVGYSDITNGPELRTKREIGP